MKILKITFLTSLFVCLFGFCRPTRKFFTYLETLLLPLRAAIIFYYAGEGLQLFFLLYLALIAIEK